VNENKRREEKDRHAIPRERKKWRGEIYFWPLNITARVRGPEIFLHFPAKEEIHGSCLCVWGSVSFSSCALSFFFKDKRNGHKKEEKETRDPHKDKERIKKRKGEGTLGRNRKSGIFCQPIYLSFS